MSQAGAKFNGMIIIIAGQACMQSCIIQSSIGGSTHTHKNVLMIALIMAGRDTTVMCTRFSDVVDDDDDDLMRRHFRRPTLAPQFRPIAKLYRQLCVHTHISSAENFNQPIALHCVLSPFTVHSPPQIIKQPPTDELLFKVAVQSIDKDKPFLVECEAEGEPAPK